VITRTGDVRVLFVAVLPVWRRRPLDGLAKLAIVSPHYSVCDGSWLRYHHRVRYLQPDILLLSSWITGVSVEWRRAAAQAEALAQNDNDWQSVPSVIQDSVLVLDHIHWHVVSTTSQ
jgi:hypothetical protein